MRDQYSGRRKGNGIIFALSAVCVFLIAVSLIGSGNSVVHRMTAVVVTPLQKGINTFGGWLGALTNNFADSASMRAENEELKAQVDTLTAENSQLVLDKAELTRLRDLLGLSETYTDYEMVGAHVISKDSGNWFSTFTIDRGTQDGIRVDCNVLAGSGLIGIVTDVGPNWALVRAIIDDDSNVSAMVSTTSDTCIIAGDLQLIDAGTLRLIKLTDRDNKVHVGDKVVTSNISEKYLPGILIGYISELNNDANNLTKSGQITPVADFRHLQEVMVIKDLKQYVASPDNNRTDVVNDVPSGNELLNKAPTADEEAAAGEED